MMSHLHRLSSLVAVSVVALASCSSSSDGPGGTGTSSPASSATVGSGGAVAAAIAVTLGTVFDASSSPLSARLELVEGGAALKPLVADLEQRDASMGMLHPKVVAVTVEPAEACTAKGVAPGCATASVELYLGPTKVLPATPLLMAKGSDGRYRVARGSYCALLAVRQVTCPTA